MSARDLVSPSPAPDREAIRTALIREPVSLPPWDPRQLRACVAMVLAGPPAAPEVCFITRAERPGDPWSGQVAFPGGRAQPQDASAQAVAERETLEEVGIRLARAQLIAPLAYLPVRNRGLDTDMMLLAFAYDWSVGADNGARPALTPDSAEVSEAFWVPVADLMNSARRKRFHFTRAGTAMEFPALDVGGRTLWGLTYRIVTEFAQRLGVVLPEE